MSFGGGLQGARPRLVACFNGTDESRDALAVAAQFSHAEGGELHVAFVEFDDNLDVEARRFDALAAEAGRLLGGRPFVEERLSDVSAPYALHQLAERIAPEMVVIGSTHRGSVGRVMPGTVGERLLHGSPCPVVIAPRGYAAREHYGAGVIGVAYDGAPESRGALAVAADLAARLDFSLRLIRVIPGRGSADGDSNQRRSRREEAEAQLRDAAAGVSGVEVGTAVREGQVADELAEQAIELDLLVMGSRGYGPVRRVLLGGVSSTVMRTAPCPVMIAPRSSLEHGRPKPPPLVHH